MLGNWKGATGTSQTDGDVVCVEHVCMCGAASGRSQTAVNLSALQRRPKAALARSHYLTLMRTHPYTPHTSHLPRFLPIILGLLSSRYLFFLAACCFIVFIHLSLHIFVVSWTDLSLLYQGSFLFPISPSNHSPVFISPFIFSPLRLCHWHSQQATDAGQKLRRGEEDIEGKRGKKMIEGEARRGLMLCCSCVIKEGLSFINSLTGCWTQSSWFIFDYLLLGVGAHTGGAMHTHMCTYTHLSFMLQCACANTHAGRSPLTLYST